jgi:hypothetical protein
MRHYRFNANQIAATAGFTDLFVIGFNVPGQAPTLTTAPNDYSQGFGNKSIVLDQLDAGDIVLPRAYAENITAVAGPSGSPLISLGTTALVTQFLSPFNPKTAALITTQQWLAANMAGPSAAQIAAEGIRCSQPFAITANTNLVVDCQNGGGDGAVATAGETWFWLTIFRKNERIQLGSA